MRENKLDGSTLPASERSALGEVLAFRDLNASAGHQTDRRSCSLDKRQSR